MTASELKYNEVYYLVCGDKEYLQGRMEHRSFDSTGWLYISFKQHDGTLSCSGYEDLRYPYRSATRKEKFLLWLKGELPGSIYR